MVENDMNLDYTHIRICTILSQESPALLHCRKIQIKALCHGMKNGKGTLPEGNSKLFSADRVKGKAR